MPHLLFPVPKSRISSSYSEKFNYINKREKPEFRIVNIIYFQNYFIPQEIVPTPAECISQDPK
jgi:hypothetical protein